MLILVLLAAQLVALPNLGSGQLAMNPITSSTTAFTLTPTTSTEQPTTKDTCVSDETISMDESTVLNQLNGRQVPNNAPNNNPIGCEDKPILIVPHTVQDEFHVPQIYKGSCDCLFCPPPKKCVAIGNAQSEECVRVYKKIYGFWTDTGKHKVRYDFHFKCECQ